MSPDNSRSCTGMNSEEEMTCSGCRKPIVSLAALPA